MPERIPHIFKGDRNKESKGKMPKTDKQKYGDNAFILMQKYRRTKMFANLGKVTYGECTEYKAYTSASLAAADVVAKEDVLYIIPSTLLITKTVKHLVPYIEGLTPIKIGEKMWESLQ